jgi:hypothetical protein
LEDLKAWKFLNGFGTRKHPRGFPQFVNRTACVFPFYGSHECIAKAIEFICQQSIDTSAFGHCKFFTQN